MPQGRTVPVLLAEGEDDVDLVDATAVSVKRAIMESADFIKVGEKRSGNRGSGCGCSKGGEVEDARGMSSGLNKNAMSAGIGGSGIFKGDNTAFFRLDETG